MGSTEELKGNAPTDDRLILVYKRYRNPVDSIDDQSYVGNRNIPIPPCSFQNKVFFWFIVEVAFWKLATKN